MDSKEVLFYFPNLVKLFGLRVLMNKGSDSYPKLRFLESCLCLVEERINLSFHTLAKEAELF